MNRKLPIRLKVEIINNLEIMIHNLHYGEEVNSFAEKIKRNALLLDEQIQRDALCFVEAVQFQKIYAPLVTPEVQKTADQLIEDLGFIPPIHK